MTNSKIKIAIVTPSSSRDAGGVERFASSLNAALAEEFDVEQVEAPRVSSKWARRLGLTGAVRARSTRRQLVSACPQIVITNGAMGFVGRGPWRRVHVYHGTMPAHSFADRRGRKLRDWLIAGVVGGGISEWLSGFGAHRVAVSASAAREVTRLYGFRDVQVIENGVRVPSGTPSRHRAAMLFVGRRESRKGYDAAVEIALEAGQKLRVAGPGQDARTEDLGVLTEDQLSAELLRAQALVFPSRYEACSLAILESFAHGCPVITTNVGWMTTLLSAVPNYEKLIVKQGDIRTAVRIFRGLLSQESELLDAISEAQRYVLQNNTLTTFSDKWGTYIRTLPIEA